jgi:hypothetical protein
VAGRSPQPRPAARQPDAVLLTICAYAYHFPDKQLAASSAARFSEFPRGGGAD